jgi:hypothetical protein
MANAHAHIYHTHSSFRPERPKYTTRQVVEALLHESALKMADDDVEKAWVLLDAARRIGEQEFGG